MKTEPDFTIIRTGSLTLAPKWVKYVTFRWSRECGCCVGVWVPDGGGVWVPIYTFPCREHHQ